MSDPKQDLAALIAYGVTELATFDDAADQVIAAGWVSPEEHRAEVERADRLVSWKDQGFADRDRWQERAEEAEAEVEEWRWTAEGNMSNAWEWRDLAEHAEATIARVEALAEEWDRDGDSWSYVELIRAALAEPERNEEGGR